MGEPLSTLNDVTQPTVESIDLILPKTGTSTSEPDSLTDRLPPETLSLILQLLVYGHIAPWVEGTQGSVKNVHQWIRYTHVCRRWRDAALGCKQIWSFVFLGVHYSSWDTMQTMLARSGETTPLTVIVGEVCSTADVKSLETALKQLGRIADLRIVGQGEGFQAFHNFANGNAPLLRRLLLNGPRDWVARLDMEAADPDDDFWCPPPRVWGVNEPASVLLPRLQSLCCSPFSFHHSGHLLVPTLTCLILRNWNRQQPLESVVQALSRMPLLTHLEFTLMSRSGHGGDDEYKAGKPGSIVLPHLVTLIVSHRGRDKPWLALLRRLSYPPTTRVSYSSFDDEESASAAKDTIAFFTTTLRDRFDYAAYQPGEAWPFSTLTLICGGTYGETGRWPASFGLWHENVSAAVETYAPPLLVLQFYNDDMVNLEAFWQPEFLPAISGLRTVIQGVQFQSVNAWRDAFGPLVQVETLCVLESAHFAAALNPEDDAVLFPKLQNLVVVLPIWEDYWEELKNVLAARRARGRGLKKLVLTVFLPMIETSEDEIVRLFEEVAEEVVCNDRRGMKVLFGGYPADLSKLLRLS